MEERLQREADHVRPESSSHAAAMASGAGRRIPGVTGHSAAGVQAEPGHTGVWKMCKGVGMAPSSLRFL